MWRMIILRFSIMQTRLVSTTLTAERTARCTARIDGVHRYYVPGIRCAIVRLLDREVRRAESARSASPATMDRCHIPCLLPHNHPPDLHPATNSRGAGLGTGSCEQEHPFVAGTSASRKLIGGTFGGENVKASSARLRAPMCARPADAGEVHGPL